MSWLRFWGLALVCSGGAVLAQGIVANIEPGPLPEQYQLGQELYLKRCSSCHIPLPPQIFPAATWRDLLQEPGHYGQTLPELAGLERQLIWRYLRDYSRNTQEKEKTPYVVLDSRYFKALHPKVQLPNSLTAATCIQCHPKAPQGDFLALEETSAPPR